jgi:hypothetical protein
MQRKEGLVKMEAAEKNRNVFSSTAGEEMALEHLGYKQGTIIDKTTFQLRLMRQSSDGPLVC